MPPRLIGHTEGAPVDPPRRFHHWTEDKLEVLRLYLKQYRRVAGGGTYIDGFAGTGQALIGAKHRDGSPIVALKSEAFKQLHCFEQPTECARLQKRVEYLFGKRRAKFRYYPGDVNTELPKLLDAGVIPTDKPCFAFLDPNGTELAWSTIEALAAYKTLNPVADPPQCKVELWVLFNSGQVIARMWPRDRSKHAMPIGVDALDLVFGGREAWFDLWEGHYPPSGLVLRYQQRLRDLGYGSVTMYELRRPGTHHLEYHMLHATDHSAAMGFMSWAQQTETPTVPKQPSFDFPPPGGTRTQITPSL